MTVTYEASAPDSNNNSLSMYILAGFGTGAAPTINDNWFMYDSTNGGTPISPIFSFTGYYSVVGSVDSFWHTYTVVTSVPAGYTTGQVVYVHVLGAEAYSSWGSPAANATTMAAAVTVDCTMGKVPNIGAGDFTYGGVAYTGGSLSADLIIQQCASTPTNTPTKTPTNTPTLTPTPLITNTATNSPTQTATSTATSSATNTGTPAPTNTATNTATATATSTATNSATQTTTRTPSNTPTITPTNTVTRTATLSPTPTVSSTPTPTPTVTNTPTITFTSTPTIPAVDIFTADKNIFSPSTDKVVTINVQYNQFPGSYNLWIYNTAGEHIKTLDTMVMSAPVNKIYTWDGTNKNGEQCSSGVYILYLVEPFGKKLKRLILIR